MKYFFSSYFQVVLKVYLFYGVSPQDSFLIIFRGKDVKGHERMIYVKKLWQKKVFLLKKFIFFWSLKKKLSYVTQKSLFFFGDVVLSFFKDN